jgi:parvulin-like peptidyl-prolyl isomerase
MAILAIAEVIVLVKKQEAEKGKHNKEQDHTKNKKKLPSCLSWAIPVIVVIIVLIAAGIYYSSTKGTVIAKVNGEPITLEEINRLYNLLGPEEQKVFTKAFILNATINEKLLLQAAKIDGIEFTEEQLENSVASYLDEMSISKEKYTYLLETRNVTYNEFLRDYEKQMVISALITKEITNKISVTDEEAKAYYDSNPQLFAVPEQVKVAHILLKTEAEAQAVLKQLQQGADFSAIAKEKSIDPSAQTNGGMLDYAARGVFVPEFSDYVFSLSAGELGIVQTNYGYHVVKLIDKKPSSTLSFDEAKKDVKGRILAEKQSGLLSGYISQLRSKASIEIRSVKE